MNEKTDENAMETDAKDGGSNIKDKTYHIDTAKLCFAKKGMEVCNYLDDDGMIENWDMLEQILDYSYNKVII